MNNYCTNDFNLFLNTNLNAAQYAAVTHKEGSLLIAAGAGSGKTRIITARIAHLILIEKINPASILALTFTNKAAQEMKERIEKFLNGKYSLPFVGTFHSYALRVLKQNANLTDYSFFSILDEEDQQKLIQSILNKSVLHKKITAKQIAYQISQIKNQNIDPTNHDFYQYNPLLQEIHRLYEQEKRASKCLDFDDLLLELLKLFSKNITFKNNFQNQINHILIDEYQDTNKVQHELLKHMALTSDPDNSLAIQSVCVVGDEDQSIYSWRGATVTNIMNFSNDFKNTILIKIEQNYRSAQPILTLANQVIQYNSNRNPKNLWSEKKGKNRAKLLTFLSEYQEAEAIALYAKIGDKKKQSQIAILYRSHFQSRAIEEALLKHLVPYKIIGGIQFYERKEIKDIFAYLKLIINPFDRTSFFRIINTPLRGLGTKFEELFDNEWKQSLFSSYFDVGQQLIQKKLITGLKQVAVEGFIHLLQQIDPLEKVSNIIQEIISKISYYSYLKENYTPEEAISKIENIKELIHAVKHLEAQRRLTISDFLDEVALMQAQIVQKEDNSNPVLLMTLHAAKGLEFDTVILTGLEEGILPSNRSLSDSEAIEEERRLFYVGITRAQERLLITHSRYRYHFGSMNDQKPSRFLQGIDQMILPSYEVCQWNNNQFSDFFSAWLGYKEAPYETIKPKNIKNLEKIFIPESSWKLNQPVSHTAFGLGIIKDIEKRSNGAIYLQVQFKSGVKKIASEFLKTN